MWKWQSRETEEDGYYVWIHFIAVLVMIALENWRCVVVRPEHEIMNVVEVSERENERKLIYCRCYQRAVRNVCDEN